MRIQHSFLEDKPTLYVVSTPIGNLGDMSKRALEILEMVDLILCEDTRVTAKLLNYFNLKNKMESYQIFNEHSKVEDLVSRMREGMNVALVSDAGTPLVNDPGYLLVKEAIRQEINVVSIPGASALLTALVSSGLLPQPFTFIGFLPKKQGELTKVLTKYIKREETLIIYESPLRISKTLKDLFDVLGNRNLVLCRELTKKFETIYRGDLVSMMDEVFDTRGEYVILLEGDFVEVEQVLDAIALVNLYKEQGLEEKEAFKKAAKDLGVHKSEVYKVYKISKT